jgi:hypothetical protein
MTDVERSAHCIDISAAPAAANKKILVSEKIHENAEGLAASKPCQMRDSDALLTLVGGELEAIYHGDPEYYGNLLTKQHGKDPVQRRLARRLTQVQRVSHSQRTIRNME